MTKPQTKAAKEWRVCLTHGLRVQSPWQRRHGSRNTYEAAYHTTLCLRSGRIEMNAGAELSLFYSLGSRPWDGGTHSWIWSSITPSTNSPTALSPRWSQTLLIWQSVLTITYNKDWVSWSGIGFYLCNFDLVILFCSNLSVASSWPWMKCMVPLFIWDYCNK